MKHDKLLKELISVAKSTVHEKILEEDAQLDDHGDLIVGNREKKPKMKTDEEQE